jgi:hypothetical protein
MANPRRRKHPADRRKETKSASKGGPRDRRARPRYSSATAVAMEALRTGVVPAVRGSGRNAEIPREDETIRVGDPDDDALVNEYVGDETPGGSASTPDQNGVDEIGRAYGLQEEDSGALRSGAEVLERRDRHRDELQPPGKPSK